MPFGNFESPFNLPFLADACGAVYVARWTIYHVAPAGQGHARGPAEEGLRLHRGARPLPHPLPARNRLGDGVDQVKYYKERASIKNGADTKEVGLAYQGDIVVGKFVDRERPTWLDSMNTHFTKVLGDRFQTYGAPNGKD